MEPQDDRQRGGDAGAAAGAPADGVVARLFAGLERKTQAGRAEQRLPADKARTVAALFEALGLDAGAAGLVLVNGLHAGDDAPLTPGDEVAIFPPLGGG